MNRDVLISNSVITTVPAGSSTVTLFDTTASPDKGDTLSRRRGYRHVRRAIVRVFTDQAATFLAQSLTNNSTTWRTYNGTGAGEAISANTIFERDVLFIGDDTLLAITTGTQPTVWEVSVRLVEGDRAVGQ